MYRSSLRSHCGCPVTCIAVAYDHIVVALLHGSREVTITLWLSWYMDNVRLRSHCGCPATWITRGYDHIVVVLLHGSHGSRLGSHCVVLLHGSHYMDHIVTLWLLSCDMDREVTITLWLSCYMDHKRLRSHCGCPATWIILG